MYVTLDCISEYLCKLFTNNCIFRIIPHLFYVEHLNEDTPISKAITDEKNLMESLKYTELDTNINKKHFVKQMPFPFNKLSEETSDKADFSLSKIIFKLSNILLTTTSKNLLVRCKSYCYRL